MKKRIKGIELKIDSKKFNQKKIEALIEFGHKCYFAGITYGWNNKISERKNRVKEVTFILDDMIDEYKLSKNTSTRIVTDILKK